jgi:hypothetical protein
MTNSPGAWPQSQLLLPAADAATGQNGHLKPTAVLGKMSASAANGSFRADAHCQRIDDAH